MAGGATTWSAEADDAIPRGRRRERFFDPKERDVCWRKADVVPGRHPERWRKDAAGNIVCRRFNACHGCLCYEYDHIIPFSKGGPSTADNCQILQTRVNRRKSNREDLASDEMRQNSCEIKFTDRELDIIEMAVYGNVIRPGLQCRCRSVAESLSISLFSKPGRTDDVACELPSYGEEREKGTTSFM
ncbi:hypothetical protein CBR_g30029 [Chara braunii]|uniref:HNH nuclease domain-containing protein n=1 Tax=Chara braunii TaxID=69332 RepID=A0A388LBR5_CHABU|nr:hypothetical protein CBR_g30029 [Chara braunii]|eukprot:GBG79765.1 hypothetical protein CBR_g30029 [Chara braunii]